MPTTSPVRVSASSPAIVATPKSVSFARPASPDGPLGHHDVRGLDVAVDDAARVRVVERVAQRRADPQDVAVGERAVLDEVRERAAADQLGHEVDGVLVAAGLVQRHDPRMLEPRRRERLALGARRDLRVVQLDPLDGDHAIETLVVREPHDAEGSGAEPARQAVAPERDRRLGCVTDVGRRQRVVGGLHHLPPSPPRAVPPAGPGQEIRR